MRCLALLLTLPLFAADQYLFTSFRGNGETGVYAALSPDGQQWKAMERPILKPEKAGELMRDPFVVQGPDGTWHMVWTWNWTGQTLGYASSKDLVHWSPQREIEVMPEGVNTWAPEAVWDAKHGEWILFWSSTLKGSAPDRDDKYNHRVYATTTRDWKTFTKARLWFDPGFNCIDATVVQDGARWILIFKDERKNPLQKRLRLAFADAPAGPWTDVTEPFTSDWVEGPTAVRIGEWWYLYFDHYAKPQHYRSVRTKDWKSFEDVTEQMTFPAGQRHGTVVRIPEEAAKQIAASGEGATSRP
jgi:hypothetical protein